MVSSINLAGLDNRVKRMPSTLRKGAVLNWLVYRYAMLSRRRAGRTRFKIGIFKPDRIGDFILGIPTIQLLLEKHGAENCLLFHNDSVKDLVAEHFRGVATVSLPGLSGRLWHDIFVLSHRLRQYSHSDIATDRLVCLRHFRSLQDELMLARLPTKQLVTVRNKVMLGISGEIVRHRPDGDLVYDRPAEVEGVCEDILCHGVMLNNEADKLIEPNLLLPRFSQRSPGNGGELVIAPFGSEPVRDLPTALVKMLVEYCHERHGLAPVTLTPESGRKRHDDYFHKLKLSGVAVKTIVTNSLVDLQRELSKARLVVSTETGTAHLAAALECRMVALIGGGNFGLFAPWINSARQQWVHHRTPCYHCNWLCNQDEVLCLTGIQHEQVCTAIDAALFAP